MIYRNSRPWLDRVARRAKSVSARALEERAGRGPGLSLGNMRRRKAGPVAGEHFVGTLETLEPRVLLAGDHFSLDPNLFPMHPASDFMFDSTGRAALNGIIQPAGTTGPGGTVPGSGDNDMFRFIAPPGANFVSVLADTVNVVGGSDLNSRVRVFDGNGNLIVNPTEAIDGTNNGVLSTTRPGVADDGWFGFVATPGDTYYVQVSGQNATLGGYIVRVNAQTTTLSASTAPSPTLTTGEALTPSTDNLPNPLNPAAQHISFPQDERIYRITSPDTMPFDSLATASARADRQNQTPPGGFLDTHLEVYDAEGRQLATDIESGFLNDAFATWRAQPGETYYIRVRGDDLRDPTMFPSVGTFQLRLDLSAKDIPIDPTTRRGQLVENLDGDPSANVLTNAADTGLFRFTAQGTGPGIITVRDLPIPAHDVAVRLYDFNGVFRAFSNDFFGSDAQIEIPVVGGETYFLVVDGFPDVGGGAFNVWIEASHNTNTNDDHVDRPEPGVTGVGQFDLATPLRFDDPELFFDSDFLGERNPYYDRGYTQTALADGRINRRLDSDLFQFVPPADMLSRYLGNNDDLGAALYTGGQFSVSDPDSLWPREAGPLGIWDANDWWNSGRTGEGPDGITYGFMANTLAAPEIYAIAEYDPDGMGPARPGLFFGGDFKLVVPNPDDPMTPLEFFNLASWSFVGPQASAASQYQWAGQGDPDGAVRALQVYNLPDGGGGEGDPVLVAGGDFTAFGMTPADRLAVNDGGGFAQLGGGLGLGGGSVRALATWDPPDPGSGRPENLMNVPQLFEVEDPEDPPNTLFIGGTVNGQAFLRHWDGGAAVLEFDVFGERPTDQGPFPAPVIMGSSINAITVYRGIDPDGNGPEEQPAATLIIAGEFTSIGGVTSPNIIKFGRVAMGGLEPPLMNDPFTDPALPNYQPRLLWEAMDGGTNGPVNALAVWDQPDVLGSEDPLQPILVVGGAFSGVGMGGGTLALNLASWDGEAWEDLGGGVDGPVHSLTISRTADRTLDRQEPGIAILGVEDPQEVLYVGGAFAFADPFAVFPNFPVPAQNIVQRSWVVDGPGFAPTWTPLNSGVNGPVFAMQMFDDQNPTVDNTALFWDRNDRPGTRMNIILSPTGDSFLNAGLRVFDSKFNLVYPVNVDGVYNQNLPDPDDDDPRPVPPPVNNAIVLPPAVDPAGMLDPSSPITGGPNTPDPITGITLWGGETYYIEVVGLSGTGRYNMQVTIDAFPPDLDGDGQPDTPVGSWSEVVNEGQFNAAPDLPRPLIHGDGTNFTLLPTSAFNNRVSDVTPTGFVIVNYNELAAVEHIEDSDLYSFIAEESGWVQVRLNTSDLRRDPRVDPMDEDGDSFTEQIIDATTGEVVNETELYRVYDSNLDGRLVIFNNDFVPITYSDSFPGIAGESDVQIAGQTQFNPAFVRVFNERDPRTVFRVERGQKYFIQVESAQKSVFEEDPDLVDWRHAIGSYELLLDSMPELNFDDDHSPTAGGLFLPTPIPIGPRDPDPSIGGEPLNGRGSITGSILNTVANPDDVDAFVMIAPASGVTTASLNVLNPSPTGLRATITVLTELGMQAAPPAITNAAGVANVTWVANQGSTYFIFIDGAADTTGDYRLDIVGSPYLDDHADRHQWSEATELPLNRFFGTATGSGVIESANDTDMFYFDAENFEVATVTVDTLSATLLPRILIYEVGLDPAGNEIFLLLNLAGDGSPGTDPQATFSTTPDRRYYFVVSGADPDVDFGSYVINVGVQPTDDHPDLENLPLATQIAIAYDPSLGVGQGSSTGVIERASDTDLFFFNAPVGGDGLITVTTPEATLPYSVQLLNGAGVVLATANASNGEAVINAIGQLETGQAYYIAVIPDESIDPAEFPLAYEVQVGTSPTDDHADEGEFPFASQIVLSPVTGLGVRTGSIVPFTDTDLFYFDALGAGPAVIEITTPGSNLDPQVRVFNSDGQQIAFSAGTAELAVVSLTATAAGQRFYVLVQADANAASNARTGEFAIRASNIVDGGGGPGPADDHANAGDFDQASVVGLESRTGDGSRTGIINFLGDTDLFVFSTLATGDVRIHVTTPQGSPLDASVRVFEEDDEGNRTQIAFNAPGIPGVTAATSFAAEAGRTFYILVEQVGANLGAYSVLVDSAPPVFHLYYPEGFGGATIDEFIPVVNPNSFDVTYTIIARYEVGERDQVLFQGVIAANSRGGISVTNPSNNDPNPFNIRIGEPYAIEIQSSGQLGATLSHYDFGTTTGESFTERTSNLWTFSEAHRDAAAYRDFLVFYNPNNAEAMVTVTLTYSDGATTTFTRALAALRRGGVNFTEDGSVDRDGVFSVKVESSAPIVAALSSYDIQNGRGYGLLGNPDGGAVEGVIPSISTGSGVESSISIYNAGTSTATVTLRATYQRADLPELARVITIGAGMRFSSSMAQLGLIDSQVAGVRYTSTAPVTVTTVQYRNGDGDATASATHGVTTALIGDAFVNPAVAGITYVEELALYNPSAIDVNITITFLFSDGTVGQYVDPSTGEASINLQPDAFGFIRIDQQPAILSRPDLAFFSIRIDAPTPFVASFNHYDLFLNGGWGALPSAIGPTVPLSRI